MHNKRGHTINPARKSWQEIEQFLYQYSNPHEPQVIVSMLDGLGTVAQAAVHLGNFDVIAFEKDPVTWDAAIKVFSQEIEILTKKEESLKTKIKEAYAVQEIIMKANKEEKVELTEGEVLFYLCYFR